MRSRPARRFAAWIALSATIAALALPAHAARSHAPGDARFDLCVGGKLVPATPAAPSHDCDACCGSTAAAPPSIEASAPLVPFAPLAVGAIAAPGPDDSRAFVAQARAPPVS